MSEELKICFSSYSYIDYLTNTISEEVLKGYKNKIVFFRKDWNDSNFYTLFVMIYFDDNNLKEILANIKICYFDLNIDIEGENDIITFLKRDQKLDVHLEIEKDMLSSKYISIILGNKNYYKLIHKFGKDKAHIILSSLREISTINDNKNLTEMQEKNGFLNHLLDMLKTIK